MKYKVKETITLQFSKKEFADLRAIMDSFVDTSSWGGADHYEKAIILGNKIMSIDETKPFQHNGLRTLK